VQQKEVLIQKIWNFADALCFSIKEFTEITGKNIAALGIIEESNEESRMLVKMQKAYFTRLKTYEEGIQQFEKYGQQLFDYSDITSLRDLVLRCPISKKTLNQIRRAINQKVNDLIAQYPRWQSVKHTFRSQLIGGIRGKFGVDKISRIPALAYEEVLRYIAEYDFLESKTLLSLALLDYRAAHGLTQAAIAKKTAHFALHICGVGNWYLYSRFSAH